MAQYSLNEITTVIASNLKREIDEPFRRMLAVRVDYWRSTLVGRSLEKHPDQRNFFTQTLWMPMVCGPAIPCTTPLPLCNIMSSKIIIPIPLRFGNTLFDYVGSIDGKNPFTFASVGTSHIMQHGRYAKEKTFWLYTNKKVQIESTVDYNMKPIPMIRIDGVFDRPLDVIDINCENPSITCDRWNDPYPITNDMLQMVTQYILEIDYKQGVDKDVGDPPDIGTSSLASKNQLVNGGNPELGR